MYVVTAANDNSEYPKLLKQCVESVERCGYECLVYDLGGLGYGDQKFAGKKLRPVLACHKKPLVMLDALKKIEPGQLLLWVDADIHMLDRVDELDTKDYDVGLIDRPSGGPQPVNSGVIFLYNTPNTVAFIQSWADLIPLKEMRRKKSLWRYGDQRYLNDLLQLRSFEATIRYLPYHVYNNYENDPSLQQGAKIVHYKAGSLREQWRELNA